MPLFDSTSSFPIAFTIAGLPIYWYALLSILGYFTAICIYLLVIVKRYKISFEIGFYYVFFALPMILLGARLWSVIIGDARIESFWNFREGGLAVQGGVIAGVLTAFIYFPVMLNRPKHHLRVFDNGNIYIKKPSMWLYADAIIPTILIGQAIGRWGNFFNGEIYGAAVTAGQLEWLKMIMPGVFNHMTPAVGVTINGITNGQMYFQPLFLYESFLNITSFIVIYVVLGEIKSMKAGTIASLYFIDYGIIRFITESLRDSAFRYTATYVLNGLLLAVGIVMFILCQWVLPKFREHRNYLFAKDYIVWMFNSKEVQKPNYNSKEYIRTESGTIFFANR